MDQSIMTVERGFRFDVDSEFDPPDLRPVVGRTSRLPEQQIVSTYFDTADLRLWEHGATLRHSRTTAEGDVPVDDIGTWILDLPSRPRGNNGDAAPSTRSWPGRVEEAPEAARQVLAGIVRLEPLREVASLAITRRRLLLKDPRVRRPWGEIDDDFMTVTAGNETGRKFRQVELELSSNARSFPVAAGAVMSELRSAGAEPSGQTPLGAVLGRSDRTSVARRPMRDAGEVVQAAIGGPLSSLLGEDLLLRLGDAAEPDVESVHKARVATRRLRSDIRTLEPVLDPVWVRHVTDDLRWVGSALGAVRDLDVITSGLDKRRDLSDGEAMDALFHFAAAERRVAATQLAEVMADRRYVELLDRLHAATATPPLVETTNQEPEDLLRAVVADRYRKFEKRASRLHGGSDDSSLHRVRIKAKRVRYAAELAEDALGKPAARTARRAKKVQTVLGDVHDAAMTVTWLRQQALHPSVTPATAFVAGELACHVQNDAADLRSAGRKSLRNALAKKIAREWKRG